MDKVILNNGTEIEGATILEAFWAKKRIIVTVPGKDLVSAAVLFGDNENTKKMEYLYGIEKDTFYGYSEIINIGLTPDEESIEITLHGGEDAHHEKEYTVPYYYAPGSIPDSAINEKEKEENGPESENDTNGEA